ncbi:protein-tyrosine-phosphatase [Gordonia iterans]|uniref:Protein-tyrosine-phosphatase n=1 Tax=Gordonia iterans TaxID=1004901 RepID=A0A2S0KJE4_9ACTN|nr:tyrosine-protein phosphatase [Gordonia iterans]AVM01805.1 protein-tyrosine-phosphatase [Gordonia iterans]
MTRSPALPAPSPIAALPNLRDLGGWTGVDGRPVQTGKLFRSTDFRSLPGDAHQELAPLGLQTIYDLRSASERQAMPDPALDGVTDVPLDVLADEAQAIPGNLGQILEDPKVVHELTAAMEGKAIEMMAGTYRRFVTMGSARASYRRFYLGLLGEDRGPALFHCTTGKDRTGWAAASFLSIVGVDRDDVYDDYLETNRRLLPALQPLFDKFASAGGDPDLLKPLLGVQRQYLDAAFDEVDKNFGDVPTYFDKALGIDAAAQERLRATYLAG